MMKKLPSLMIRHVLERLVTRRQRGFSKSLTDIMCFYGSNFLDEVCITHGRYAEQWTFR